MNVAFLDKHLRLFEQETHVCRNAVSVWLFTPPPVAAAFPLPDQIHPIETLLHNIIRYRPSLTPSVYYAQ